MTEKKVYIAMDVGCYECGEPSILIGVFGTKEDAQKARDQAHDWQKANWHGQHSFPVYEFDLDEINKVLVTEEYYKSGEVDRDG